MSTRIHETQVPSTLRRVFNRLKIASIVASADPRDNTYITRNPDGTVFGICSDGAFTIMRSRIDRVK